MCAIVIIIRIGHDLLLGDCDCLESDSGEINVFFCSQRTKMSSSGGSHRVPHSYSVPKGNGGKVVMEFVDKVYDQAPGFQVSIVFCIA